MITGVAVCPAAAALLPENVGRVDVLEGLRARAVAAVAAACGGAERVVLVAATDVRPLPDRMPLGERVGRLLLSEARVGVRPEALLVEPDAAVEECRSLGGALALAAGHAALAIVVVGDGSACRGERAPGHVDERAFGYDAELVAGLAGPDPERLLALDPGPAAELLVAGRAPLQVLAGLLLASPPLSPVDVHVEDPLGVLYLVAHLR